MSEPTPTAPATSSNTTGSSDAATTPNNDFPILVTFLKIVIVAIFIYPLAQYAVHRENDAQNITGDSPAVAINNGGGADDEATVLVPTVKVRTKKPQPSCPISYLQVVLVEICQELYTKHEQCTPEDVNDPEKHKLPRPVIAKNNTTGEPRGTIVGCIAAGLLMTSLGAAFVELYKAKSQSKSAKTKPSMSRKCSLADLTVLKHHRKELVRKESILELPEASGGSESLKQLAFFRPPPLDRRSSFPVGPYEVTCNGYYGYHTPPSPDLYRRTSLMEPRRFSIIDTRRSSVDCRKLSMDASRRISMDDSPERRHWSRLVHRH